MMIVHKITNAIYFQSDRIHREKSMTFKGYVISDGSISGCASNLKYVYIYIPKVTYGKYVKMKVENENRDDRRHQENCVVVVA